MTTTVIVHAHLATSKEVQISISDRNNPVEQFTLQDGEKAERYVYDGREISVKEVEKVPPIDNDHVADRLREVLRVKQDEAIRVVGDLSMLVMRLAHTLRKASPDSNLPEKALDYLKRESLLGSVLRDTQ